MRRLAIILLTTSFNSFQGVHGFAVSSPLANHPLTLDCLKNLLREIETNGRSKESILGSRLPLNLNRTCIGTSLVDNAGRGLFATMDCQKDDLLTCYPGDVLVHASLSDDKEGDEETFEWGSHVPKSHRMEDIELHSQLSGYILQVTEDIAVLGLATLDEDNLAYAGHFANDGARPPQRESHIASYVLESNEIANAMHISIEDCHMATIATRDIQQGDEILVTYGPEYWREHASWNFDVEEEEEPYDDDFNLGCESTGKGFG